MTRPAALPFTAALLAFSAVLGLAACDASDPPPLGTAPPSQVRTSTPVATDEPSTTPYDAPAGALLSVPDGSDRSCLPARAMVANAEHAPPGSTIRIVTYELDLPWAVDALVAAHRRGVRVQVLVDNRSTIRQESIALLVDELGTDRRSDSFIVRARGSARGELEAAMHQKTWMFSRTGRSRWVTMVGSLNLDLACTVQYNDVYSFVGRRDVHGAFVRIFRQQIRDRPVEDPARVVRLGRDTVWFFPGFDRDDDPVQRLLGPVPADPGTRIRLVQLAWSGERGLDIARLLVEKRAGGARVEVLATLIGEQVAAVLRAGGIEPVGASTDAGYAHNKLILVSWTGDDGRRRRVISTGSDNLGDGPFGRDEVVVDVAADTGVARRAWRHYAAYVDAFARAARER